MRPGGCREFFEVPRGGGAWLRGAEQKSCPDRKPYYTTSILFVKPYISGLDAGG